MRRVLAVTVLVAALSGASAVVTAAPPPLDQCKAGELACGDDLAWADALEAKIDDHLVADQVVELTYRTAERVPGDIANVGAWGDSGLWTGTYLAAESYRFAVASKYLKSPRLTPEQRVVWTAHRESALSRVRRMVDKYHLLVNIAEGWRTTFSPSTAPLSFGGGVVQGERGMLMRACAPANSPPTHDMEPNKRVFGPFPWKGVDYVCETAPSRDTYAGTTFGLLTAFDLVSSVDESMRQQIKSDLLTLAGFLVKYGWNYPRPHGNVSLPPSGHDFDNFASPLFVYVPMARLNMAQAARHVADEAGTLAERARWNAIYAEEVASQLPLLAGSMEVDSAEPNAGYYKFNLHHLTGHSLLRLERSPELQAAYRQAVSVMDATTGDDVNAHFETITYAMTGDAARRAAAITHLREWRDYRTRIDTGVPTTNSTKCGVSIECVPKNQLDIMVAGQDVAVPRDGIQRARLPLPVADRPPTDFLWQREPTQLNGSAGAEHQAPGVDYLLPYWMLRYLEEVEAPAHTPFPPYPGPAHQ